VCICAYMFVFVRLMCLCKSVSDLSVKNLEVREFDLEKSRKLGKVREIVIWLLCAITIATVTK